MKTLRWIKDHIVALLLGIVGILGVILAVKHEREKVSGLKLEVELAKLKGKREALTEAMKSAEDSVERWEAKDAEKRELVTQIDKAIQEVRSASTKMDAAAMAARFNQLYPSE
jgi:predicted Holliday junction resolvase-like endonuclease